MLNLKHFLEKIFVSKWEKKLLQSIITNWEKYKLIQKSKSSSRSEEKVFLKWSISKKVSCLKAEHGNSILTIKSICRMWQCF